MLESTMNYRGQVTLPGGVRDALGLKAGDRVRYVVLDEGVLMMPVQPASSSIRRLRRECAPVSLGDTEGVSKQGSMADSS